MTPTLVQRRRRGLRASPCPISRADRRLGFISGSRSWASRATVITDARRPAMIRRGAQSQPDRQAAHEAQSALGPAGAGIAVLQPEAEAQQPGMIAAGYAAERFHPKAQIRERGDDRRPGKEIEMAWQVPAQPHWSNPASLQAFQVGQAGNNHPCFRAPR
jgi:hypothetical protein